MCVCVFVCWCRLEIVRCECVSVILQNVAVTSHVSNLRRWQRRTGQRGRGAEGWQHNDAVLVCASE